MANIVIMPKQGLQMTEGLITKWLKKAGDEVKEGEPLFEMETDKLTITIDSSFGGTLLKIIRGEGEEVPITEPIAVIGDPGEDVGELDAAPAAQPAPAPTVSSAEIPAQAPAAAPLPEADREKPVPPPPAPLPEAARPSGGRVFITPRAKMRCAQRGITDYSLIPGSGGDGLIIERDVLAYQIPQAASVRAVSRLSVRADMGEVEQYVAAATAGGVDFSVAKLIRKAADAAAKRYGEFENAELKTLCDTDIEEYFPSLPPTADLLLSAGGIYTRGERRLTVLSVIFDEDVLDEQTAAGYLSRLKRLLENPLLMMAL